MGSFVSAGRLSDSRFTVPGAPPRGGEPQGLPPETLHHERYDSARQNQLRRFAAATTAGYERARGRRYPVLALLPGMPGGEKDGDDPLLLLRF